MDFTLSSVHILISSNKKESVRDSVEKSVFLTLLSTTNLQVRKHTYKYYITNFFLQLNQ